MISMPMPTMAKVTDVFASTSHGNDDYYARLETGIDYFAYAPEMVRCRSDMGSWEASERPFLTPSEHTIPSQPECYEDGYLLPHMTTGQEYLYQQF